MNLNPKFSIITPSFNQGNFIEQTILSVQAQHYPNYEHIIMDGGSKDETLDVLNKYSNVIIYRSEEDRGQVHAINKGLALASGDIIGFINSDDYYLPNAFHKVNYILREENNYWLTADSIIVDRNDKIIHPFIRNYKNFLRGMSSFELIKFTNYICQPSTFWKAELIKDVGVFNESYNYAFDYDYWIRLHEQYEPVVLNDAISAFRIHSESKGNRFFFNQFDEEIKILKVRDVKKLTCLIHRISNLFIKLIYLIIK